MGTVPNFAALAKLGHCPIFAPAAFPEILELVLYFPTNQAAIFKQKM
jgi:hypothetical protein